MWIPLGANEEAIVDDKEEKSGMDCADFEERGSTSRGALAITDTGASLCPYVTLLREKLTMSETLSHRTSTEEC